MPNDFGYKPVQTDSVEHKHERRLQLPSGIDWPDLSLIGVVIFQ